MKKRKRLWASALSFGMTLALVLSPLQMAAAAEADQPVEEKEPITYYALSQVPENIRQLVGVREDDGRLIKVTNVSEEKALNQSLCSIDLFDPVTETGQIKLYGAPVKYLDDNGDIQFIDTSLKSTGGLRSLFTGDVYENQANAFTVRYASSAYQGYSVDDMFRLSLKDDGTASAQNAVVDQQENGAGSVRYAEAFGPGTLLEYINTEGGVKENIILNENIGKNRFEFTFRSDEYHPMLTDDGQYVAVVSNSNPFQVIYRFNSLFAFDSYIPEGDEEAGPNTFRHLNENCYYELTEEKDGSYTITVVVPEDYLNHPEVVYPVTIDPTLNSSNSAVSDTFTFSGTYDSTYGCRNDTVYSSQDYIRVGTTSSGSYTGYVRFDGFYNVVPYSSFITGSYINLTYRSGQTTGKNMVATLVSQMWSNSSITGLNSPTYNSNVYVGSSIKMENYYYKSVSFNVLNMARLWHNSDDYENAGIRIRYTQAGYDTNGFVSANGAAGSSPTMTIDYMNITPADGVVNGGIYSLRNRSNGQYLALVDGSAADGTKLTTAPYNTTSSTRWEVSGDSGYYIIRTMKDTNRYAVLGGGGNCVAGTLADLYGKDSRVNYYGVYFTHSAQLWNIKKTGNSYYLNPKRNMFLALTLNTSTRQVYMDNSSGGTSLNQQWEFIRVG